MFDGGGFAFAFGLGVAGYLTEHYDIDASQCDVYGVSIGNVAALGLPPQRNPDPN